MKYKDRSNWQECAAKKCPHFIQWDRNINYCGWYSSLSNPKRKRNARLRPCHLISKCPFEKGGKQ